MELCGLLEEEQAGVGVHHVLYEGHKVLRHEVTSAAASEKCYKLGSVVMAAEQETSPGLGQLEETHRLCLVTSGRDEHGTLPIERVAASLKTTLLVLLNQLNLSSP